MSANPDAVMQILGLGITTDMEMIQKALIANNNRVDDAITWLFSPQAQAAASAGTPDPPQSDNILNKKAEVKPAEIVSAPAKPRKSVDERKIELEKKAMERQLKKDAEEKEREFALMKMKEDYEVYQADKEIAAEETRRRVEELKRAKAVRAEQQEKKKQKVRMGWHAKQAKYAAKENELNKYVLQALEKNEKDLSTPVQAINNVMSLGNLRNAQECFTLISKILANILKNPKEQKFRSINRQKKKVELLIVGQTGAERLLILLGFVRSHAELTLSDSFSSSQLKRGIEELKETMEMMKKAQSVIRKKELVNWHCAVSLVLDSLQKGPAFPASYEMCNTLYSELKPFITDADRKQTAIQILKFHETQLWFRHPLVPLFRELKHKVVDAAYLKRIIKLSSKVLGSDQPRINVKKLGTKISNMTAELWTQFFEICGYVAEEDARFMKRSPDVNPVLFSFLSECIPKQSAQLIPA